MNYNAQSLRDGKPITFDDFGEIYIPYPPIDEQTAIADYLDKKCLDVDNAITRHKAIIEKLEEYRKSVITQAVTKGLSPEVEMKDSGIPWVGAIPNTWRVVPLWSVFAEKKHKNIGGKEQNLLSLSYGCIKRKDIETVEGLVPENYNGYNIVSKGDIVLRLTDLQNDMKSLRTGLVKETGIITSAYVTLTPSVEVSSGYYRYLLHAYDIKKVFYGMGGGMRQSLNYYELSRMRLLVPPIREQNAICRKVDMLDNKIDEAIDRQKQAIEKLEEYRKSVIYNAVTGKINCMEEQ